MGKSISDLIKANPFYNQPLDASSGELAVNRKAEFSRLERVLNDASQGIRQNYAALGEDGSGKTSLLNLLQAKAELFPRLLLIRLEITSSSTELQFFKSLVGTIVGELEKVTGGLAPFIGGDLKTITKRLEGTVTEESSRAEVSVSIAALFNFLGFGGKVEAGEKTAKGRYEDVPEILPSLEKVVNAVLGKKFSSVVVMIDEAGYIASETTRSLLQRMRLLFQKSPFMLIVAGSPVLLDDLIQVEPTFGNLMPPNLRIHLPKLSQKDVRDLIASRLSKVRTNGRGLEPFTAESADEVFRQSKGIPRDAVLISHEALEIALNKGKTEVEIDDVIEASKLVLAGKGRDTFARLKDHERELVLELWRSGDDYLTRLATKLEKRPPTLVEQMKRMIQLGYAEVSRKEGNMTYYRPARALLEYLSTTP